MNLAPGKRPTASAHTSWIGRDQGLLFLEDLLPVAAAKSGNEVNVRVQLPAGWSSSEQNFKTTNVGKTVVLITRAARNQQVNVGASSIDIEILGEWKFDDQMVAEFAKQIFGEYRKSFGELPTKNASVYLLPFPTKVDPGNWEGDTRGNTVIVLSSDMPFQTQSVQRLHELRHEIFHLWFPNALSLMGNYDWFYEGFALYQSLKLAVALNRLRFDDLLDTLSRAITIDSMLTDRRSLLDATTARFSSGDTVVYARGMLAALLTDIQTMKRSGGKNDVSTILRKIYEKYRVPAVAEEGNSAVIRAIDLPSVTRFVTTSERVEWASELKPLGIEAISENNVTTLRVAADLSSSQKKFLDKLGYNNWRKSAPASK
jgi:predicted metalloprotease with PDZ domain